MLDDNIKRYHSLNQQYIDLKSEKNILEGINIDLQHSLTQKENKISNLLQKLQKLNEDLTYTTEE